MKDKNIAIIFIIAAIIVSITGAYYYLTTKQTKNKTITGGKGNKTKTLTKWYKIDNTQLGPSYNGPIKINYKEYTFEGSKISIGDEVTLPGSVEWVGSPDVSLNTYGVENVGIYLLLTKNSSTGDLAAILYLGEYKPQLVPQPSKAEGTLQYVNHDGEEIQELGGENATNTQLINIELSATYQQTN